MRNWLVVANSARARVLEETDRQGVYLHVADLVHPQSRQKGIDLDSDRPGQAHAEGQGHGLGNSAYAPRTDAREREHDRFARELAAVVDAGVARGACAGFQLVASNPFLGHLKSHLGDEARKRLLRTVAADCTGLRDEELAERLGSP
jgi:protein required for attachment to host cells